MRLHHIGILVSELEAGVRSFDAVIPGLLWSERYEDVVQQVEVRFAGGNGGPLFEVIAPLSDTSPVQRALKQRRDIINHMAYLCDDISAEGERLRAAGCFAIGEPKPGIVYGSMPIQFFLTPEGFLLELIENMDPKIPLAGLGAGEDSVLEGATP
jgi:methylmalonyl-CoA/ethylmalonyl-CoA epimerase